MIEIIPAARRFSEDLGWLKTNWLFSFSHYYDPANLHFGALRVFNDDVVMPGGGFPDHPHANFEIVTIVLSGAISHADNMGNATEVRAGEVQRMSAGRGVVHSEWNRGTEPAHLYQLWFLPSAENLKPGYAQARVLPEKAGTELTLLVSGFNRKAPLTMDAAADIYAGFLSEGAAIRGELSPDEGVFGYIEKGEIELDGKTIVAGDQFRISHESSYSFGTREETLLLLIKTVLA